MDTTLWHKDREDMEKFEKWLDKFADSIKTGNFDMAIMRDKFIQIGYWKDINQED